MHLWADYIELFCLRDKDNQANFEEALDEKWGGREAIGGIDFIEGEDLLTQTQSGEILLEPESHDNKELLVSDLCAHLKARESLFGDAYPFIFNNYGLELKKDNQSYSLYIFFLLAANLNFFQQTARNKLTSDFECLSALALRHTLPQAFEVCIFGTASCSELVTFPGSPRKKIEALSKKLGTRILIPEHELARLDTPNGDAGLDIVAWLPFEDSCCHSFLFLGQAGCTKEEREMFNKQGTVNPERWVRKLANITPLGLLFTPQCYRNANKEWVSTTDLVYPCFDRFRLTFLLLNKVDLLNIQWVKSKDILSAMLSPST